MSELKRCPFCGGEAELKRGLTNLDNFVECVACGCRTKLHNTKKSAIKAWNTRKPIERIVERLEEQKAFEGDWDDEMSCGAYNAYNYAITVVKKEGGMNG